MDYLLEPLSASRERGKVAWKSPSNIALVKYWGKYEDQIPANPSLSFTLSNCYTETSVTYQLLEKPLKDFSIEFYLEGEKKTSFLPKIEQFLSKIDQFLPFLHSYHLKIESFNSFPHSSGIASSASGMSALALCLLEMTTHSKDEIKSPQFIQNASFLARLGSGSAARSIQGPLVEWGKTKAIPMSSDLYGIPYPTDCHKVFKEYQDCILLVDKGQKQVSSTKGHDLMNHHPFAKRRFEQAHEHISQLLSILRSGDLNAFVELVELEALTLHAMMMTSSPSYVLMKPQTLEIIERVRNFRSETGIPICFTLDAGANVHLLYPYVDSDKVLQFITNELVAYCENGQYICDQIGEGSIPV
jgi:diphosphomevalonate decarboxylase